MHVPMHAAEVLVGLDRPLSLHVSLLAWHIPWVPWAHVMTLLALVNARIHVKRYVLPLERLVYVRAIITCSSHSLVGCPIVTRLR